MYESQCFFRTRIESTVDSVWPVDPDPEGQKGPQKYKNAANFLCFEVLFVLF
jgi:hypothetical protein